MMMLMFVLIIISIILYKFNITFSNSLLTAIVCHNEVKMILA